MRIQRYDRKVTQPSSAGGELRSTQAAGLVASTQAQGFGKIGAAAAELARRSQEAQRVMDVSNRTLALRKAYGDWWAERSADPTRWQTLTQESDDVLAKLTEGALKGVDDQRAQAAIMRDAFEFGTAQGIAARKLQIEQQVEWSRAALFENTQVARSQVAQATDGFEANRITLSALEAIRGSAGAGIISPLEAAKQERDFLDGIAEDKLNLQVYQDPEQVLEDIYAGSYSTLSEDARQRIILNAEKRAEALRAQEAANARRLEATERRQREEAQDYRFGAMYEQAKIGALGKDEAASALAQHRIRAEQFRTLWDAADALERGGGPGNPQTAEQLRRQAYGGELTMGQLITQAESGGLNATETAELVGLVNDGSALVNSRDYREAVSYLDGQLGFYGQGEGMSQEVMAAVSAARRELYQRARANPEVDLWGLASEIAKRYSPFDFQPFGSRTPRFETPDAAVEAFRLRKITQDELNTELLLHERTNKGATQ